MTEQELNGLLDELVEKAQRLGVCCDTPNVDPETMREIDEANLAVAESWAKIVATFAPVAEIRTPQPPMLPITPADAVKLRGKAVTLRAGGYPLDCWDWIDDLAARIEAQSKESEQNARYLARLAAEIQTEELTLHWRQDAMFLRWLAESIFAPHSAAPSSEPEHG